MKLIAADKLREQIAGRIPNECYDDKYNGLLVAYGCVLKLIDEAPDLSPIDSKELDEAAEEFAHFYDNGTCDGIAQ